MILASRTRFTLYGQLEETRSSSKDQRRISRLRNSNTNVLEYEDHTKSTHQIAYCGSDPIRTAAGISEVKMTGTMGTSSERGRSVHSAPGLQSRLRAITAPLRDEEVANVCLRNSAQ